MFCSVSSDNFFIVTYTCLSLAFTINFEGGPGILLLNFEGGPKVPDPGILIPLLHRGITSLSMLLLMRHKSLLLAALAKSLVLKK